MEPSDNLKSFAERIKQLRINQKKMTVAEAAKQIGAASANLNNWERGIARPPLDMLSRLASFYDVTVDYLVGHEPNEKTKALMNALNTLTDKQKDDVLTIVDIIRKKEE